MKKTLVALAALAATGASFAQVTISGYFGASYDSFSITSANAARTGNSSETRISDQSSRIIFGVAEDLGGGLKAIGQYDMRFNLDAASRQQTENMTSPTPNFTAGGNSHVGITGDFGAIRLGRQDIYYTDTPSLLPGGLYLAANMAPVYMAGSMANWSRTPNLGWWTSPRFNGFELTLAHSTNPTRASGSVEVENDMGTADARRKGYGNMFRVNYTNGPLDATLSSMDFKSDYTGGTAYASAGGCSTTNAVSGLCAGAGGAISNVTADQKGTNLVVKYQITNALRVAVGTVTNDLITAAGSKTSANSNAFSVSYDMGPWNFAMHQANKGNNKVDGVEAANTGTGITSVAATYNFSKRTAAGLMFSTLKSDINVANPGLFYQSNNAYGGQMANFKGETANITSLALRHNF